MLALDWTLHYERSNFLETGRYDEAIAYCRRLAKASPYAHVIEYGKSPQGRKMVALLVTKDGDRSPAALARSAKPLVFVQNGIHSGEIEGKDASLVLLRDILITGSRKKLLEGVNLLIVPIYSVDAHERFGAFNRINQNGPREMGWRATAQNYNLNRDWIKADAPETRNQIRLIQKYRPDYLVDNHTTDGADYPYVLTLSVPATPGLPADIAEWQSRLYERIRVQTDLEGFLTSPYFTLRSPSDLSLGLTVEDYTPRYSHGYWSALNRPSTLVETHVLKPYRQRVDATYSYMRHLLETCIREAGKLKAMNRAADAAEAAGKPERVLANRRLPEGRPFEFLAHPFTPYRSPVSGGVVSKWDRSKIERVMTTIFDRFEPSVQIEPPAAYAIPPEWNEAIDRVQLHGLRSFRTRRAWTGTPEGFRFSDVTFPAAPFEGRFSPRFRTRRVSETRTLPEGTLVVSTAQVGAKLLMAMLEPEAPDALVRWGFFNTIFEPKETYADYAMEPVAQAMLRENPALKAEFDQMLADPAFAASPDRRLRWLYERSPFSDPILNRYPVVRLDAAQLRALKAASR